MSFSEAAPSNSSAPPSVLPLAGMYQEILTLTSGGLAGATCDLSSEGLSMCKDLTLAQAQACVYEKALGSKKADPAKGVKPSVLSKIAQATADFYSDIVDAILDGCTGMEGSIFSRDKVGGGWVVRYKGVERGYLELWCGVFDTLDGLKGWVKDRSRYEVEKEVMRKILVEGDIEDIVNSVRGM